jgi:hypothetical protein
MTLRNLLGITLDEVVPDKAQISKLFAAAQRNVRDARLEGLSAENRFDAAYKAIMQLAMIALNANGFRTLTSKPGHHQTAIQALSQTVAVDPKRVIVLDALRKQRNVADYSGDLVSDAAVTECIHSAEELLAHVLDWLKKNKPELVETARKKGTR